MSKGDEYQNGERIEVKDIVDTNFVKDYLVDHFYFISTQFIFLFD